MGTAGVLAGFHLKKTPTKIMHTPMRTAIRRDAGATQESGEDAGADQGQVPEIIVATLRNWIRQRVSPLFVPNRPLVYTRSRSQQEKPCRCDQELNVESDSVST